MKVVVLNGNKQANDFDVRLKNWINKYPANDFDVEIVNLRELDIKYCTGCWGCWVKTPGQCVFNDDSKIVGSKVIHADLVVFASPMIMGFPSSLLKIAMDKLIPLVLPYIEIVQGECHHEKRYDKYPKIGLLLSVDEKSDEEDIEIVSQIFRRFSLNFKSDLEFVEVLQEKMVNAVQN